MNPFKFIKNLISKKEETIDFPIEFSIAAYTKEGMEYGIFEDTTKEIRHYKGEEYISRPYMKALLIAMDELGVPTHNITKEQVDIPILKRIYPERVEK